MRAMHFDALAISYLSLMSVFYFGINIDVTNATILCSHFLFYFGIVTVEVTFLNYYLEDFFIHDLW